MVGVLSPVFYDYASQGLVREEGGGTAIVASVPVLPANSIVVTNASGALASSIGVTVAKTPTPGVVSTAGSTTELSASAFGLRKSVIGLFDNNDANADTTLMRLDTIQQTRAVYAVAVTAGGANYPNSGAVTFSSGTATGTYAAVAGVIQSVTITNGGSYADGTVPTPIFATGGTGSGATGTTSVQTGKTGLIVNSYTMYDNGGDTSGLLALQTGGGGAITAYRVHGLRPNGYTDWSMSGQGAMELTTDGGSQSVLAMAGSQIFPSLKRTTVAGVSTGTGTGSIQVAGTTGFPTPGGASNVPANAYPATLYLRFQTTDGAHTEWVSYTAVGDGTHFTVAARGLGGSTAFDFPVGSYVDIAPRSDALHVRVDDGVSGGIIVNPNNGQFDSNRLAFAVAHKVVGGAPVSPHFSVKMSGRIGWSSSQNNTGFTTVGAAGAAATLPAAPLGYFAIEIDGNAFKVPYYNP